MKKLVSLLALVYITLSAHSQDAVFYKLSAGSAPVLDGNVDALWDTIQAFSIDKVLITSIAPTPNTSTWKAVWNDTAIFVIVKLIDDYHCDQWCSGLPDWDSDRIELYFDVNDTLNDHLGASNAASGHIQITHGYEQGVTQQSDTTIVDWAGNEFSYAYKTTADTIIYEYAIKYSVLKDKNNKTLNPVSIDTISFDVTVNDRDADYASRKIASWKNDKDFNWTTMDYCGKVVFKSEAPSLVLIPVTKHSGGNPGINVGYTPVGVQKDTTIYLCNRGEGDLLITSVTVTGSGFSVIQPTDLILSSFEKQPLSISYMGSTSGRQTGQLIIASNDPENMTMTIDLVAGNGVTVIDKSSVSGKWFKSRSPYLIDNDILIPDNKLLEIEPGVQVEFQGHYMLNIKGCLLALGTKDDSIRFTVKDTAGLSDLNSENGGWLGLNIWNGNGVMNDNDTSKLEYCIIEYAKTVNALSQKDNRGAGMYVLQCKKLKISDCTFRYNYANGDGGAMYISNSEISITGSKFYNNFARNEGGAIGVDNNGKPIIKDCQIMYNTAYLGAGIRICCNSIGLIENSLIANNKAIFGGGGVYLCTANSILINNIISNNDADTLGGGILINNCQPSLYNNNICFNKSIWTGSGIHFWDISPANLTNNILWGNYCEGSATYNQIELSAAGQPNIYNCIIQDGYDGIRKSGVYKGDTSLIISENPVFTLPPSGSGISYKATDADWNLSLNSVAINRGKELPLFNIDKDFYNNKRILHSVIDIGAVEKHIFSLNVQGELTKDTKWVADTIKVTGDIKVTDSVTLEIAPGTVVEFQDHYLFKAHGRLISKGLPDAMIKFTVKDTTGFYDITSNEGSWNGISMNNSYADGANYTMTDDSLIFDYTIFEFAKNLAQGWNKTEGGAIQIKYFSKVRVSNCILRNNTAATGAGINIDGFSNPVILNNKIYNNKSFSYGGGGINIVGNSNPLILNNFIANNYGEGALAINSSNPTVINNVISNNRSFANAGGVMINTSNPFFSNNTIVNNYASWEGGGMCIFDCDAKIYNTILWGNYANSGAAGLATYTHPVLYNCIVEKGRNEIGNVPDLEINNLITENPSFNLTNTDIGLSDSALISDWSINDFSSAINKAIVPSFTLPAYDIAGNYRINQEKLDVGAYENQGSKVEFVKQPVGNTLCVGNSITFSVTASDTAKYQWQKDGADISGANSSSYTINSVQESSEGNYSCIISNSYGNSFGNPAFVKIRTTPEIVKQSKGTLIQKGATATLEVMAEGSKPLYFKWKKDGVNLADTTLDLDIEDFGLSNEGVYTCNISNNCGSVTTAPADLYVAPSICLVTVARTTNSPFNIVVWQKESKIKYSQYKVYRETSTAGYYENIGTVSGSDSGIYRDKGVDPKKQSYLYKITGVKSDNSETDINLSKAHKTIHLLVTKGEQGGIQLDWDQYIGFPYSTYYINRSVDGSNFTEFDSLSTSSRTWTDFTTYNSDDTIYYFVSVKKKEECCPGKIFTKAGGGDVFTGAESVILDNRLQGGVYVESIDNSLSFSCYPNPYSSETNVKYTLNSSSDVIIEIFNELGKVVAIVTNEKQQPGLHEYKLNTYQLRLSPGVYTLRMRAGNKVVSHKLVQMK